MKIHTRLLKWFVAIGVLLGPWLQAVDTAFWKPYETDVETFYLQSFDESEEANLKGYFGKGWRGPIPYVQAESNLYISERITIEAWVKLDKRSEKRAFLVKRPSTIGKTQGFELFIEPDGRWGMAVVNTMGHRAEIISDIQRINPEEWTHLAGVCGYGSIALYQNGILINDRLLKGEEGLSKRSIKSSKRGPMETHPAPFSLGEGLEGTLDEVRIHSNVTRFWPKPEELWIETLKNRNPPDVKKALISGRISPIKLDFESLNAPESLPDGIKWQADGALSDGIIGNAFRGTLKLRGPLGRAEVGSISFWSRPVGYSNFTDRNQSILNSSLFSLYFFNTTSPYRPVTMYFRDPENNLRTSQDSLRTEVYSGRWYHYTIRWNKGVVQWYINGEAAGAMDASFPSEAFDILSFSKNGFGDIDEVLLFPETLTDDEVKNLYWLYVDPSKLIIPQEQIAKIQYWFLPSTSTLAIQLSESDGADNTKPVQVIIENDSGWTIFEHEAEFLPTPQLFRLPELNENRYHIRVRNGEKVSPPSLLERETFEWEDNQLGITDEVFPPFEEIRTIGNEVYTVGRRYQMNAFGLCDEIMSLNQNILAAPMRLIALDKNNQTLNWKMGPVEILHSAPHTAVYTGQAASSAVTIKTLAEVEMDGMVKVRMKLQPIPDAIELHRLTLEIPLKEDIARLMQEVGRGARSGYTGAIPAGNGEVWSSKDTLRDSRWLNTFTGYIWMGGVKKGLAWFAENDKGWVTAKNHEDALMRLIRSPGRVTLQIDLVNVPGIVDKETELIFGFQVSPGKPLPEDVRTKAKVLPSVGLPVHPWGGLSCSWKSPWMNRWEVVDKVMESLETGDRNRPWFEEFAKKYNPPKVHGVRDWVDDMMIFTSRPKPLSNPVPVYFEEMNILPFIEEYKIFQDEWSLSRLAERSIADVDMYRRTGGQSINPRAPINYSKSYQDYALALMNEWWKRGVSIYWDNTYLRVSENPWTSAAYVTEDGRIQPANTLWNQREYMKRTWNLMHYWRKKGIRRPLEFVAHMTNANMLPLFTWATCNYDLEMRQSVYARTHPDYYTPGEPFTPEYLQATSMGQQVGNYPYLVLDLFQSSLPPEALGYTDAKTEVARRSWGMRMVHEIISGGPDVFPPMNKAVYGFGYGSDQVDVINYWDEIPAFSIRDERVKGLLLARKSDQAVMLILQSWSKEPLNTTVQLNAEEIGFVPGRFAYEGIYNEYETLVDLTLPISLKFPYETRIYLIQKEAPNPDVLFEDSFNRGVNAGWDYISPFAKLDQDKLSFNQNTTSWLGKPRLIKSRNLPEFKAGELAFTFQIDELPGKKATVLEVGFGNEIKVSKHGLTHSYLSGGITFELRADPDKGWEWKASMIRDGKATTFQKYTVGTVDTAEHELRLRLDADGKHTLYKDGKMVLEVFDQAPVGMSGFSIMTNRNPDDAFGGISLDDVSLTARNIDRRALIQLQQQTFQNSQEIVAAQFDELRQHIIDSFGAFGHAAIYNLAMFRNPEQDMKELTLRLDRETNSTKTAVLLSVMAELLKREKEHIQSMTDIGQPALRVPEFKKARAVAVRWVENQSSTPELQELKAQLNRAL